MEREAELKLLKREVAAAAQLELRARAANINERKEEAEVRAKLIDEEMLKALRSYNLEQERKAGRNKRKRQVQAESESEKENESPADGSQAVRYLFRLVGISGRSV